MLYAQLHASNFENVSSFFFCEEEKISTQVKCDTEHNWQQTIEAANAV